MSLTQMKQTSFPMSGTQNVDGYTIHLPLSSLFLKGNLSLGVNAKIYIVKIMLLFKRFITLIY